MRRACLRHDEEEGGPMPLYEYQCEACGRRFELIRKFSDPPLDVCPTCGGSVHKLMSSPAFQFKGSGWYITDYAKKGGTSESDGSKAETKGQDASAGETGDKGGKAKTDKAETAKTDAGAKNAKSDATSSAPTPKNSP
jgi:putative FmdB family regulatory protein